VVALVNKLELLYKDLELNEKLREVVLEALGRTFNHC